MPLSYLDRLSRQRPVTFALVLPTSCTTRTARTAQSSSTEDGPILLVVNVLRAALAGEMPTVDTETQSPDWMHSADTVILDALRRTQPEYVPIVANRLGMHLDYVDGRCRRLVECGLMEQVTGEAVYCLTDRGEEYLAGELVLGDLPDEE